MKKVRILLIALCFAMILPLLVACKKDDEKPVSDDKYVYDDSCREKAADSIPEGYDLENQTIGIFYAQHTEKFLIGDEESTDIVFSKIYERNLSVEERLNVDLDLISSDTTRWQEVVEVMKRDIQTMANAYEIIFTTNNTVTQELLFNYFYDLNDSEYIDIEERWWYPDAIMETSIDNYNYRLLYGDISIGTLGIAGARFYNKALYEQYLSPNKDGDELYQKVFDGTWTLEEFTRITKKAHIEKGGDGSNDIYGFSLFNTGEPTHYFREAADLPLYTRDEYGMIEIEPISDRLITFVDMLYECYWENEGAWLFLGQSMPKERENDFPNEKVMFLLGNLNTALQDNMREMKQDFGIVPFPKLDEEQELYKNFLQNGTVMVGCPVSADIERVNEEVSAVIEALASESYRSVAVPYYEMALKTAYTRDDMDAHMIDIITGRHDTVKSTLTKNFAYEYLHYSVGQIIRNTVHNKNTNVVSQYDSMIGSAGVTLKQILDDYKSGKI
ncbi:MAG: hypothetical protein IJV70_06245 [Clostridia bacterium]|nr:hypothetical protein [Clostridia bacterium]